MAVVFWSNVILNTSFTPTSAQSSAFLARTSGLTVTQKTFYDTLITGLVNDGVWALLDVLYILAAPDSTTALLNLISSSFTGIVNGSPTFTINRGYTGVAASTTDYIDTQFNPTVGTPLFVQDNAHISCWSNTTGVLTSSAMGAADLDAANAYVLLYPRFTGDISGYYINDNPTPTSSNPTNADGLGHYLANRSGGSVQQGYKNSTDQGVVATNSLTLVNTNSYLVNFHDKNHGASNGWGGQLCSASFGGSMTAGQVTSFYNRLRTYMTAVGVP